MRMCVIAQTPLISPFGSIGFREREKEREGRGRGRGYRGRREKTRRRRKNIKKCEKIPLKR